MTHNPIVDTFSLRVLKELPLLHVLSISEISSQPGTEELIYFVIFNNPLIKVKQQITTNTKYFNGIQITEEIQTQSTQLFSGKFNFQDLQEQLGTSTPLECIREIDLQSLSLNKLTCFLTDSHKLPNLKKLNLVNNLLTNADDLVGLSGLSHLNLSGNLIKRVFSDEVSGFDALVYLGLANNQVKDLGDVCFEKMPGIRIVHLHSNCITKVYLSLMFDHR